MLPQIRDFQIPPKLLPFSQLVPTLPIKLAFSSPSNSKSGLKLPCYQSLLLLYPIPCIKPTSFRKPWSFNAQQQNAHLTPSTNIHT